MHCMLDKVCCTYCIIQHICSIVNTLYTFLFPTGNFLHFSCFLQVVTVCLTWSFLKVIRYNLWCVAFWIKDHTYCITRPSKTEIHSANIVKYKYMFHETGLISRKQPVCTAHAQLSESLTDVESHFHGHV